MDAYAVFFIAGLLAGFASGVFCFACLYSKEFK